MASPSPTEVVAVAVASGELLWLLLIGSFCACSVVEELTADGHEPQQQRLVGAPDVHSSSAVRAETNGKNKTEE
jgi:hypothetical protein